MRIKIITTSVSNIVLKCIASMRYHKKTGTVNKSSLMPTDSEQITWGNCFCRERGRRRMSRSAADISVAVFNMTFFFKNILDNTRSLIPLFLLCLPWVSKPGWIPCWCTFLLVCNEILRFTSGATPTDRFTASIAAEPVCTSTDGSRTLDRACRSTRYYPFGRSGSAKYDSLKIRYSLETCS